MGLTPRSVHQSLAPAPVEGTWNAWVRFLVEILAAVGDRMLRPTQSALLKAGDHIQLIPRYLVSTPDGRGSGRSAGYGFVALPSMVRGVLPPGRETRVDR